MLAKVPVDDELANEVSSYSVPMGGMSSPTLRFFILGFAFLVNGVVTALLFIGVAGDWSDGVSTLLTAGFGAGGAVS